MTANRASQHGRRALIVSEVAFALLLTIGAGLMLRSFARVRAVNPGFDPENVVTFRVSLPTAAYPDADRIKLTEQQLVQRLREIPGVLSASATSTPPMQGDWLIVFTPEGPTPSQLPVATNALVLPGFFEAMRIPLRAGRRLQRERRQGDTGGGDHQRDNGAQVLWKRESGGPAVQVGIERITGPIE